MKTPAIKPLGRVAFGLTGMGILAAVGVWQHQEISRVWPGFGHKLGYVHQLIFRDTPGTNIVDAALDGPPAANSSKPAAVPTKKTIGTRRDNAPAGNKAELPDEIAARRTPAEMRLRGEAIMRLKLDKNALATAFLEFTSDLTGENWVEAFEGIYPVYGKGLLPQNAWEDMMRKIGTLAGAEAMEKFRPQDSLMDYEAYGSRFAMEGWARSDPAAARNYLESLPDGRFKDGLAMGFFPTLVKPDRSGLESLFTALPESYYPQIATALREKVRWEEPQGIPAVQNWLEAAGDRYGKDSPAHRAIQQAAQVDLLEHAEYDKNPGLAALAAGELFANPSAATDRALDMGLRVLSDSQPRLAFQYLEQTLASRPKLADNVPAMVERWTREDLGGPGDWLNTNRNSPLYASTVQAYAKVLNKEDPAAAQQWLSTLGTR